MIRLLKVKEKQRELAENASRGAPIKKQSAGYPSRFPSGKDDLMNFEVSIRPDEGYYIAGKFLFSFQVSPIYPHEEPKVKCKTKQPNYEDPLNHDAARVLRDNPKMLSLM